MTLLDDLRRVPALADVPDEELAWLAPRLELRTLDEGEVLVRQGDPAVMEIQFDGELRLLRRESNQEIRSLAIDDGQISGRLPFSRMRTFLATVVAARPTRVGLLDPRHFDEMHAAAPVLLERLVQLMLDRAREFTRMGAQREKLLSLGTMSAGLAHELNNPAAAARRTAQALESRLQRFDELSTRLLSEMMFEERPDEPFAHVYKNMVYEGVELDPLERSDLEDELGEWLEERGVAEPWEVASTLVGVGLSLEPIERTSAELVDRYVPDFLSWLQLDLEMRLLVRDLLESTGRISELVGAMKSYSYMDQGQDRAPTDIHTGLRNTLAILNHKIRSKAITVERDFGELPEVIGYGGELNQVWTNLIDNAVAAAPEGGTVLLRTRYDGPAEQVVVEVHDDGPGVPEELRSRIFEPFFTTKGVGEGTGMGLDIANRIVTRHHFGSIQLRVREGDTCFEVRLPVS